MRARFAILAALLLGSLATTAAQAPAGRPPRAQTDAADYAIPSRLAPGIAGIPFLAFARGGRLFGVAEDQLFVSRIGEAVRSIPLGRAMHSSVLAVGGDGRLWLSDANGVTVRVDELGNAQPISLAAPALAIAADGVHTDVLEATAVESFDAEGNVHRIPLGRTIAHGSIAALPNEIVVAADSVSGIVRIDRNDRVEILKLEDDMRPATLRVVGNTVWFPLRNSRKTATRRIGRVHDRTIQSIDLATFAPILDIGVGADNRFAVIESFDVFGIVSIDGQLACERSIGTGFPGSVIAQIVFDEMGSTYLTTSRVPSFVKVIDGCR